MLTPYMNSRVVNPSGEVENVEVRKRKYEKTKVRNGSTEVIPRLFLCGRGAPPIQERSDKPVCLDLSWFTRLQCTSQGLTLPAKYGSEKKSVGAASY